MRDLLRAQMVYPIIRLVIMEIREADIILVFQAEY